MRVAIRTDDTGGGLVSEYSFVGDAPGLAKFEPSKVGTICNILCGDTDSSRLNWHLVLLPRTADRKLVPIKEVTEAVMADWHWSLLPLAAKDLRRCGASVYSGSTTIDVPLRCTVLFLGCYFDLEKIVLPQSLVELAVDQVLTAHSASNLGASANVPLPRLRKLSINFDRSLLIDREKEVVVATALFALVPASLTHLKFSDLGGYALQAGAELVRRLPCLATLHLSVDRHPSIRGFDLVLAALPRSGFGHLHLALTPTKFSTTRSPQYVITDTRAAQLASSLPESVQSLVLFSPVRLPRVSLATNALTIDVQAILGLDPPPFSPTLTHLTLDLKLMERREYEPDSFAPILGRLPSSLVHLELHRSDFSEESIHALVSSFPPKLESLSLFNVEMSTAGLTDLASGWPLTLRKIDLLAMLFGNTLPDIPSNIRGLSLNLTHMELSAADKDAAVAAWITVLPPSVRTLKLYLNAAGKSHEEADTLVTVTRRKMSGWKRMQEWAGDMAMPSKLLAALMAHFEAFEVEHCVYISDRLSSLFSGRF
ncbi:hypothetical protein AMAG_18504 [Allomyces macrogynus ATCC 38327]|uniref:Uncharacterized protein n=1 Tax=Allomyces macrogynus (strain ATCC 38327) TaxID=578462 RepID=A0A0L0SCX6_ALLM3|nr:hypothetical protein AMAG_18504 [Allomyces macrogynus ATCC 38327]|eukprot:KNE60279.1 hypothetical protein AMAG_18504 [Allomyces macrogynus ATCC 38327]